MRRRTSERRLLVLDFLSNSRRLSSCRRWYGLDPQSCLSCSSPSPAQIRQVRDRPSTVRRLQWRDGHYIFPTEQSPRRCCGSYGLGSSTLHQESGRDGVWRGNCRFDGGLRCRLGISECGACGMLRELMMK